jgi:hypothetical protein
MYERRGLRLRVLLKPTPGGNRSCPRKRNWMLRPGGMADRRGLRPRLLSNQLQAEREPAHGNGIGCFVLAGWLTDGAFGPVCSSKQLQAGKKGAGPGKWNWMLCSGWMADRRGLRPRLLFNTAPGGKGAGPVGFKVRAPGAQPEQFPACSPNPGSAAGSAE